MLHVINDFLVMEIVGPGFDYAYLSTEQTRGGNLVAWRNSMWSAINVSTRPYSVSVKIRHISLDVDWWLTAVYGSSRDQDKPAFLTELNELR
jgi:hypothetical protein